MLTTRNDSFLSFVWRPCEIGSQVVQTSRQNKVEAIFDCSGRVDTDILEAFRGAGAGQMKISAQDLLSPVVKDLISRNLVETLWVEFHSVQETLSPEDLVRLLGECPGTCRIVPITGDLALLDLLTETAVVKSIALKGSEAIGFVSSESIGILWASYRKRVLERGLDVSFHIWGGVATPEAAAAFLACGAEGIVFESLHWQTDLVRIDAVRRERLSKLRPEQTTLVGGDLGISCRLFDRGNSAAVKDLTNRAVSQAASGLAADGSAGRALAESILRISVPALESDFSRDQVIPLGPEAAFSGEFSDRYGPATGPAFQRFRSEVLAHWRKAPSLLGKLVGSPAATELKTTFPLIQGAMSWITDVPEFALAVSEAGGLPTVAVGLKDPASLRKELKRLQGLMGGRSYAVNVIALPENPYLDDQLAVIEEIRPPFVVVAAGDPAQAKRLLARGIEIIYVAAEEALVRLAFQAGVRWVVLEGNEAGGHVGALSTLTLFQTVLKMKRHEPDLFADKKVLLAGGIFNRQTAFLATMLGAEALQMGTVYLTTEEIVRTGALSQLYQRMIIESGLGDTALSGQSIGLRVRALKTPKMREILDTERKFQAGGQSEFEFRKQLETLSAGSLHLAARTRHTPDGPKVDEEICLTEGQFMSGAVSGALRSTTTLAELHGELVQGPLEIRLPEEEAVRATMISSGDRQVWGRERIAITGVSLVNSLGNTLEEVWANTLALKSGLREVPAGKWNHGDFYDPTPLTAGKTYSRVAGFMDLTVTRKELGIAPQDFRTMSDSTKLSLFLARRAIDDSGIVDSDLPRERIGVVMSQNSGEVASTVPDLVVTTWAKRLVRTVNEVMPLDPDLRASLEGRLRSGRLAVDDTTLVGRLSCTAGGYICNIYGFQGPSYAVTAACATSQVALYSAIQMIRNGVIDAAVVGGGEELLAPAHFLEFAALGALAGSSGVERRPGRSSRPFDLNRDGMVLGEGGGMIVIERESVAKGRGAEILAYITGIGGSNNHRGLVESLAAGQMIALKASLADAGYGPDTLDLVECHATGTVQGDREEMTALKALFPQGSGTVLTSYKSQIGHTLGASGLNNLFHGLMAMRNGVFPATLNYETPDPTLGLEDWGFRVTRQVEDWVGRCGGPRRFMANSFGFGGANYVVQVEECLDDRAMVLTRPDSECRSGDDSGKVVVDGVSCFTGMINGRRHRVAVVAESEAAARAKISAGEPAPEDLDGKWRRKMERNGIYIEAKEPAVQPLAVVFAGQGTAYPGMGRRLYEHFPIIRTWMDQIASLADYNLLKTIFEGSQEDMQNTCIQQPALFCLEYAIWQQLKAWGVKPGAVGGHSLGELTALCVAEAVSWEDGFRIIEKRAQCMGSAAVRSFDPGTMIAVEAPWEDLRDRLDGRPNVFFTNINSPRQSVLGGGTAEITALMAELESEAVRATRLNVSMAFHSPIMATIRDEMAEFVAGIDFSPPRIPVASNAGRGIHGDDVEVIKQNIITHLESPVYWMQNVQNLWQAQGIRHFVEVGPRATLCNLVADTLPEAICINTCHPDSEKDVLLRAAARLFTLGHLETRLGAAEVIFPAGTEAANPRPVGVTGAAAVSPGDLGGIIQREINSFVLESFGKYLKPAILAAIRREADPTFTEARLAGILKTLEFKSLDQPLPPTALEIIRTPQAMAQPAVKAPVAMPPRSQGGYLEQVIRIIMEATGYERDEIEPDMDIRKDLAIRSSRLPVIMDAAERQFGISIVLGDFIEVKTVRDLADRIAEVAGGSNSCEPQPEAAVVVPEGSGYLEQVIGIIMEATGYERDEIEPDMDIRTDLAIRSSRLPVIMDAAERRFEIKIVLEDFVDVRTVGDLSARITEVILRQRGVLAENAGPSMALPPTPPKPAVGQVETVEEKNSLDLTRMVFKARPVGPRPSSQPLAIKPGAPVVVLAFGNGPGVTGETMEYVKNDLKASPVLVELGPVNDLSTKSGAEAVVRKLSEVKNPAGLVLILDAHAEKAINESRMVTSFVTGYFQLLQIVTRSPEKRFCLLITAGLGAGSPAAIAGEGILGLLLAASQEYGSILFRALDLGPETNLKSALPVALDLGGKTVQLMFRGQDVLTWQGEVSPLSPSGSAPIIKAGDVVIISGGGRGITPALAEALSPFRPRLILLGRKKLELPDQYERLLRAAGTREAARRWLLGKKPELKGLALAKEIDNLASNLEIAGTLRRLTDRGCRASYHACDVTDRQAVENLCREVLKQEGRIDGLIHGAGIIRDSFLQFMTADDFRAVMEVKLLGALNMYEAARDHGLRFMVGLSSIAAMQGSAGQGNYCAGNRSMTLLLESIAAAPGEVRTKALILPPIEGAGMADDAEIKELIKLKGLGGVYVHVDELASFFGRELVLGPAGESRVMLSRDPEASGKSGGQAGTGLTVAGVEFGPTELPMIGRVEKLDLRRGSLQARRVFSTDYDLWLEDHRPFKNLKHPLVSGIMAVETMLEAARVVEPHLLGWGLREVWFNEMVECPVGMKREMLITCDRLDASGGETVLQAGLATEDLAYDGRPLGRWTVNFQGQVIMSGQAPPLDEWPGFSIRPEELTAPPKNPAAVAEMYEDRTDLKGRYRVFDTTHGMGPGVAKAAVAYGEDRDLSGLGRLLYSYPLYLLEAILQLPGMNRHWANPGGKQEAIPRGIGELRFTRPCRPGEKLVVDARLKSDDALGQTWDACVFDGTGTLVMRASGVRVLWFQV
jgi:acyl transferase domain-containing protein/NAD(P)H-dependent flavin oxidoreductase YrpB (nitropropane dioxygenase family)/NAD(P)-dependent dehydrogenase (short-subunit alcohol dehydrogenase family)/acyl carrier protein